MFRKFSKSRIFFTPLAFACSFFTLNMSNINTSGVATRAPIAIIVSVEIKEDRIEDFLVAIEADAIGSRTNENGGCLRFDVLRQKDNSNAFVFYEVYADEEAMEFHRNTPHFKLWTDFKASGGVVSQSVVKCDGTFFART